MQGSWHTPSTSTNSLPIVRARCRLDSSYTPRKSPLWRCTQQGILDPISIFIPKGSLGISKLKD